MRKEHMKRRTIPLAAAALIAVGAVGDHIVTLNDSSGSPVAAQTATSTPPTNTSAGSGPSNAAVANPAQTSPVSASAIDAATVNAYATASRSVVYVVSEGVGSGSGVI